MSETAFVTPRRSTARRHWSKHGTGYLFVVPAALVYLLFVVYPFVDSIYLSLVEWNGVAPVKRWVGLANYRRLLHDDLVWVSLRHNVIWVVVGTVVPIALGLFLAVLLAGPTRGATVFRTAYFLPVVLAPAVIAIIWGWIYHPLFGVLNRLLREVGLDSLARGWLGDVRLALYAVLAAAIWAYFGFVFVIFQAALQNVNQDLLDAARVDGANAWQRFWHVTIPQIANVMTMVVAIGLIGGFNVFDIVYVMTQGGPANSTELIATYTYQKAFGEDEIGYGAALSMVMTLLSLVASVVFIYVRERREQ
jgi:multiple sugar transport system permease protein/raffinose/stachyose/melibiose transport system permease protein